mmetsp:Transcript_34704/g.81835  ORF Transcript_34704/g.81835 Transcript_34704/m.81835 type:complete len:223 (-) Transcript_34704:991-1659(-)
MKRYLSYFFVLVILLISVDGLSVGRKSTSRTNDGFCSPRRQILKHILFGGSVLGAGFTTGAAFPRAANSAPPISIIAEELGYFPVTTKDGDVTYVPKRVSRKSSPQAIELAKILKEKGVTMYGAYWCPHCSRQKELFGAEAWSVMDYVECSPKGYGYKGQKMCEDIEGYPTFRDRKGRVMNVSGERPIEFLAQEVRFSEFDPSLEEDLPAAIGTACKLPTRQ